MLPTTLDRLADLGDNHGWRSTRRDERPRTGRLDVGLHYEIPGPGVLAQRLALPLLTEAGLDAFQHDSRLVTRQTGSTATPTRLAPERLAADLLEALRRLPERRSAGRQYRDLRLFVREAHPETVSAYLAEVATSTRVRAARWRPSREGSSPTRPARTGRERTSDWRRRIAGDEEASARWWLENYLDGWDGDSHAPEPGTRVNPKDLYCEASEVIASVVIDFESNRDAEEPEPWEQIAAEEDYPVRPREPGRTRFYTIADEVLGERRVIKGIPYYIIPERRTSAEQVRAIADPVSADALEAIGGGEYDQL